MTHNEMLDALEKILDTSDVATVTDCLGEVCSAKADHLEENWQDYEAAKVWNARAGLLMHCAWKLRGSK